MLFVLPVCRGCVFVFLDPREAAEAAQGQANIAVEVGGEEEESAMVEVLDLVIPSALSLLPSFPPLTPLSSLSLRRKFSNNNEGGDLGRNL